MVFNYNEKDKILICQKCQHKFKIEDCKNEKTISNIEENELYNDYISKIYTTIQIVCITIIVISAFTLIVGVVDVLTALAILFGGFFVLFFVGWFIIAINTIIKLLIKGLK